MLSLGASRGSMEEGPKEELNDAGAWITGDGQAYE